MQRRYLKGTMLCAALVGASLFTGCGGSGRPQSYEAAVAQIESPTGTVDEESALPVAEEFETASSSGATGFAGSRDDVRTIGQEQSTSFACDSGSADVSGSGDQHSGSATYTFNACCMETCCMDGVMDMFVSSSADASYSICYSYDLSVDCEGEENADMVFSGCMSADGGIVYSVEVDGDSYAVSGYYSDGNGELTIRGENGEYTCTYTDGAGSCVDESGEEFTF